MLFYVEHLNGRVVVRFPLHTHNFNLKVPFSAKMANDTQNVSKLCDLCTFFLNSSMMLHIILGLNQACTIIIMDTHLFKMEFIPCTISDFCFVDSITANITKLGHICVLFVIFFATLANFLSQN